MLEKMYDTRVKIITADGHRLTGDVIEYYSSEENSGKGESIILLIDGIDKDVELYAEEIKEIEIQQA